MSNRNKKKKLKWSIYLICVHHHEAFICFHYLTLLHCQFLIQSISWHCFQTLLWIKQIFILRVVKEIIFNKNDSINKKIKKFPVIAPKIWDIQWVFIINLNLNNIWIQRVYYSNTYQKIMKLSTNQKSPYVKQRYC